MTIRDRLPFLIGQLMQLAEGVTVEGHTLTGETVVYQKPPDRKACEYLVNRVMGTPIAREEQGGPGDFDDLSLDKVREAIGLKVVS